MYIEREYRGISEIGRPRGGQQGRGQIKDTGKGDMAKTEVTSAPWRLEIRTDARVDKVALKQSTGILKSDLYHELVSS